MQYFPMLISVAFLCLMRCISNPLSYPHDNKKTLAPITFILDPNALFFVVRDWTFVKSFCPSPCRICYYICFVGNLVRSFVQTPLTCALSNGFLSFIGLHCAPLNNIHTVIIAAGASTRLTFIKLHFSQTETNPLNFWRLIGWLGLIDFWPLKRHCSLVSV